MADHLELQALFEEDQTDSRQWIGAEAFLASQARRARAEALIAAGALQTADDYYHAGRLFQHGETLEHWWRAHELGLAAAERGHPQARWLAAAALDRWLLHQGRPQRFGTQRVRGPDGNWRIWDTDPATTDADRAAWAVPAWATLQAETAASNAGIAPDPVMLRPLLRGPVGGVEVEVTEWEPLPPWAGIPPYVPPAAADPRPTPWPPGWTAWRFAEIWCAKDAAGTVVLTWHRCRWRVLTPGLAPESVIAHLAGAPVVLTPSTAFWTRLIRPAGPATAWLCGGTLPVLALDAIAASLPEP